jgi:predicted transcriptional regulator
MDTPSRPSFIERLTSLLLREPEDREQLLEILHSAYERNLMDADALTIIEGALAASDTRVTDVMIPRAQMYVVDIDDPMDEIIPVVIEAAHSRFPVINGDRDKVLGVLLAKDLLRIHTEKNFDLRDWLRPVVFIPESKRLNVLLREFRVSRNHMAIVVNEYGGVAGLVTIEDVLEQIVGDIEDEYDFDEAHDNIPPRYQRPFPRQGADRDLRFQRGFLDHVLGRGIRYCGWSGPAPPRAACRNATKSSTSTAPASRCCAPTAAGFTPCSSRRPPNPKPVLKTLLAKQPGRALRHCRPDWGQWRTLLRTV